MKQTSKQILMLFTALIVQLTFAQEKTITGTVTDSNNMPLPGVNILIRGTNTGTQSDFDGNYSIQANKGSVLVYKYLGFSTKEVAVGDNPTINVKLAEDAAELEEVVVTARGLKAKPRSLSYAIATVGDDEIENTGEVNLVSSLTAKAPGVSVVSSSGSVGASANIRIRGNTSILRNNSPLFIVDGVPIDNSSVGNGTGGADNSNRAIDINQNDIESISILKGIAAQTLYGLRAANGVVIINTKKGRSGSPTVSINTTVQMSEITQVPDLQREFAQGNNGVYSGPESQAGSSWGPRVSTLEYNGDTSYPYHRFGALVPAGTGNGRAAETYDHYDFFVKGLLTDLNASVRGGTENIKYYISAGKLDQTGVSPRENFAKKSFRSDITANLSQNFEISASGAFVNSGGQRVQRGSNISGIMLGLLRTTPTFDNGNGLKGKAAADELSVYQLSDGTQRSYRAGVYDNPYWTVAKNPSIDDVNRFTGRLSLEYRPYEWLTLQGRYAYDRYSDIRKNSRDIFSAGSRAGRVIDDNIFNEDITTNFMALFNKNLSEKITFNGLVGYEHYSTDYLRRTAQGDGLTIPGFFDLSNTSTQINTNQVFKKELDAVYADAKFGFNEILFLNASLRNDWSSTLPTDNNDFLSYSTGLSFVFSELFENEILNYGKLRASYGKTGNDAPIYSTKTFYQPGVASGDGFILGGNNNFPAFGVVALERAGRSGSNQITPEKTTEYEIGGELKFFNSRIGLDITYYDKTTVDQVFSVDAAPSTGFTGRTSNAGKIENKGFEIGANFTPVRTDNFSWDLNINWTSYESKVIELAPGVESFTLEGFTSTSSRVLPGESYGAIFGSKYLRDDNNNILIDDNGLPIVDPESGIIGDPIPDWQMGIKNTFSYKNLSIGFLFDIKQGGDMWCGTCGILDFFGVSQKTGDQREITNFVYDGIVQSTGQRNTQEVALADNTTGVNVWTRNGFGGIGEDSVFDTSWVRLREASLTYNFGEKLTKATPISSGSITFSGRNLWLSTDYPGVDPETNLTGDSNGIGLDYFNQPNTRSYAVSLKLNF
ncbi:SusC/RagA family TonB-linked outer membrane protein [Aquimarina sp. TRL1]|uniref:SusC/RagA family TonB-linked outer membrane protein n=1 Tax=Aquimarina sp. (strain TRL1) TaxID=2736252 RepID=UPI00158F560C|nr:SusC/RagA family TonB-linked outer membrane protein [Aquimarina sp. TRL1]QKX03755.1 SusC/RagA family TonB-linked outer membrane protein [Aquimarina sp. TRL1]